MVDNNSLLLYNLLLYIFDLKYINYKNFHQFRCVVKIDCAKNCINLPCLSPTQRQKSKSNVTKNMFFVICQSRNENESLTPPLKKKKVDLYI